MALDNLDDLFNLPAIEAQVGQVDKLIDRYLAKVAEASKASRLSFDFKGVDTLEKLVTGTERGAETTKKLTKAVDELAAASRERERLQQQVVTMQAKINALETESGKTLAQLKLEMMQHNRELKLEAQLNGEVEGSIKRARAEVVAMRMERDKLNLSTEIGKARQLELNAAIDKQNEFIRVNNDALSRQKINVGNYEGAANGLRMTISQMANEIPNFFISWRTGLMSLTNQWGQVTQAVKQSQVQNELMRAEGQKTIPVFKQILTNLVSWQTAIIVGGALLYKYGEDIKNFLTGSSQASALAEKANKKYAESLKNIEVTARGTANEEIARLRVLESVATGTTNSMTSRKKAVDEMQRLYPAYLQNIKDEVILQGNAKSIINDVTAALMQKAMATAAEKKFAAASERSYELTLAQRKAELELRDARAKRVSDKMDDAGKDSETKGLNEFANTGKVGEAKKNLADITAALKAADEEALVYLQDAQKMGAKAFDLFKEQPEKKTPRVRDTTREEIQINKSLNDELIAANAAKAKAVIETDQHAQEAIFKNEKLSLEERKAALEQYHIDVLALIELEATAELEKNRVQHQATIARINHDIKSATERNTLIQQENKRFAAVNETIIIKTNEAGKRSVEDYANTVVEMDDKATKTRLDNLNSLSAAYKDNDFTESLQQHLDKLKELMGYYQQFASVLGSIGEIGKNENTQRLLDLEDEADGIKKRGEEIVRGIEAETISNEEKEEKKRNAEAKTAAMLEANDQKQRYLKYTQALADRDANIAAIIQRNALAVVTALTEGDPYTKLIRAAAAGAIGLGQLLVAKNAPLPKYAKGTDNHPFDSPAIVGDGGRHEVVVDPAGNVSLTPNRPTIMDLAKGSMVFPSIQDFISRMPFMGPHMLGSITKQQDINVSVKAEFEASAQKIVDAINTKKQPAPVKLIGRDWGNYLTGNV